MEKLLMPILQLLKNLLSRENNYSVESEFLGLTIISNKKCHFKNGIFIISLYTKIYYLDFITMGFLSFKG